MATYYQGNSDFQPPDGLQTLVLMNPAYSQYTDEHSPATGNFVFLNTHVGNSLYPLTLPHTPPSLSQHLVGAPSPVTSQVPNSLSMHTHHDVSALHGYIPRAQNSFWTSIDQTSTVARETTRSKEGLSLTLSSHPPGYGIVQIPSRAQREVSGEDVRVSGGSSSSASGVTNNMPAIRGMLHSSKYLRAAQEVLDEVANAGNGGVKKESLKKAESDRTKPEESLTGPGDNSVGADEEGKPGSELSPAEKQEIQMKKAKLINMLDEVEQRYRQHHHQMQILISSFEQAAGIGSARTYTALALQTISKQFRCLKDGITAQIRVANKNLGEEDGHGKLEGSRLRFIDHQLHQQRALQSLGMIQHNAWRPQRGLPERSVSVLRAWLFEHFLHPYPKDSDKHMLAKQTGLTRSQVSNWFINARVRLWKPMVEEMYTEEIKEQEHALSGEKSSKSNDDSTSKSTAPSPPEKSPPAKNKLSGINSKENNSLHHQAPPAIHFSSTARSVESENVRNQSGFWLIGSSELDGITQGSPKRQRIAELTQSPNSMPINIDMKTGEASNEQVFMKFNHGRQSRDGYSFIGGQANFIGGFGQYPIADIDRLDSEQFPTGFSGNGVSLTLGLHSENLSLSAANQSFLPNQTINYGRRVDIGEPNGFDGMNISTPHSTSAFDGIGIPNRKRFAAQLLPDFVA